MQSFIRILCKLKKLDPYNFAKKFTTRVNACPPGIKKKKEENYTATRGRTARAGGLVDDIE